MDAAAIILKYESTIRGVETQSCDCGGVVRTGDAWREGGCGWSPEYWHDMESRGELASLMQAQGLGPAQLEQVAALDWRLKKLLAANGVSSAGDAFWRNGLPIGVAE